MIPESTVTLGLCVKNIEATVAYTIKSIVQQDFPHELVELIVVDGYSEDNTLKIIKKYILGTDIACRFFFENKGLGFARQIVVDNALGDYVVWVDGDLVLTRDYLRKQVGFMERHPAVAIGRARYGIWPDSGPIAYLENIPFVVETSKYSSNLPLGICGTEGAIHNVKAMRQVGGFDVNIRGAAEDIDLARLMLAKGWEARMTDATFYELCRESWRDLWDEYSWWGFGGHFGYHKTKELGLPFKMSPLGGFLAGCLRFPSAYKLTHRKLLLMLPFHYAIKRLAFCYGFTKAHFRHYGHPNV